MRMLAMLLMFSPLVWAQSKAAPVATAQTFKIDPDHTSIVFKINHLGFANVFGMISGTEGQFVIDDAKPANSSFEVTAKPETINTMVKKRDEHLKSPDFFNVKQHPLIKVKSTSVKSAGKNKYSVTADVTLNGVTKPVKFVFNRYRTGKDPWGKTRTGGEAVLKLKRSDYKMTFMTGPDQVGDEVDLFINVEGVLQ